MSVNTVAVTVVNDLNNLVNVLNAVSPGWYLVAVGPLANVAQHFLKKERQFSKGQNKLIAVLLAALAGAFYGVLHTTQGQDTAEALRTILVSTALIGSPTWIIGQLLFHGVSNKLDELNGIKAAVQTDRLSAAITGGGQPSAAAAVLDALDAAPTANKVDF